MTTKKIAILGAGASGLTAIKTCIDEGFSVTCFELLEDVGGLWRYYEEEVDGVASLMRSTIINSSKEMSAFSDYPPPAEYPNYMHNSMMVKYLESYAKEFRLRLYIKFSHKVLRVTQSTDYESTGRWLVEAKNTKTNQDLTEIFDGVMVCTGHLGVPNIPKIKGLENFEGDVIHTHSYKKPDNFLDKNSLVIGVGNSGGDVAVELSSISKKVYLSTRSGCWILKRLGPEGLPFDIAYTRRWINLLNIIFSGRIFAEFLQAHVIDKHFRHSYYNLKPNHTVMCQHPMVNDVLPCRILSGMVVTKNNVHHFTPNGVVFIGEEDVEYPIDSVVLATGYLIKFPFLGEDIIDTRDNKCSLYKYMLPPQLRHPSLVFVGLVQSVGALIPVSELQCRWYAQLMAGKVALPNVKSMLEDINKSGKDMAERYIPGTRHTIQVDVIPYMDDIAIQFGAKPNLLRLFITDLKLFLACFFGPYLSYAFRLEGPGRWEGARNAILTHKQRVLAPLQTRKRTESDIILYKKQNNSLFKILFYAIFVLFAYFLITKLY